MIKMETRDWVALASAAAGLAAFVLLRAPPTDNKKPKDAPWARSNVVLALAQFAEAVPAEAPRVTRAILAYLRALKARLAKYPLGGWAQQRWQDISLGVQWALDHIEHVPAHMRRAHESDLVDLLRMLHTQGSDWETYLEGEDAVPSTHAKHVRDVGPTPQARAVPLEEKRRAPLHGGATVGCDLVVGGAQLLGPARRVPWPRTELLPSLFAQSQAF